MKTLGHLGRGGQVMLESLLAIDTLLTLMTVAHLQIQAARREYKKHSFNSDQEFRGSK